MCRANHSNCLPSPCGGFSPPQTTTKAPSACWISRPHSLGTPKSSLPWFTCWTQTRWVGCRSQSFSLRSASWYTSIRHSCALPAATGPMPFLCNGFAGFGPYICPSLMCTPPVKPCRWRRHFSPQTRINRFVFLSLPALSLETHLGLTVSPHAPFPTGYVTLPVCGRSPPFRLTPSRNRGQPSTSSPPCSQ